MNSSTVTKYFTLVKASIESRLDANAWRWSTADSLFLDWCVWNVEGGDE